MRNEVFNSKKLNLFKNSVNVNDFTVKPIRGEDGNNQICVTYNKNTSNAISFFANYRLKGTKEWVSTHVEKVSNVINIKNLSAGIYQIRIVSIDPRHQTPSDIKEVEITADLPNKKNPFSETVKTIASNLADDIIAQVFSNLSKSTDEFGYYDQKYMT